MVKALLVSAAANMIWQFNTRNIEILLKKGVEISVATNFDEPGTITPREVTKMKQWLEDHHVAYFQVDFKRGLGSPRTNWRVIQQLRQIIRQEKIDFVHSQSPIGGVLARIAAWREHVRNLYMVHGFHFFTGAPKKYWLVFYPLEYLLSYLTDILVVINDEDEARAHKLHQHHLIRVHGVGIDLQGALAVPEKVKQQRRQELRQELKLTEADFMLLNIGELSVRKNQRVIIQALAQIQNPHLQLFLAGIGPKEAELTALAEKLGIASQVHFLGYRNDLQNLHYAADLNVFPSHQEGLALGGLESVADGLYLLGSDIRGIRDYISNDQIGQTFAPNDVAQLVKLLQTLIPQRRRVPLEALQDLAPYDQKAVDHQMAQTYQLMLEDLKKS
ncbi:glycosyltransferase [Lactobacillus sp. DCY120]|uniref:Glycosyltransferase n=1 Tax=Bombilactobacillus apium TaxID=2675299 RepID=A0A850RBA7_9LACO|nr:glycosyltransferase [Bombilactobacillus apium]NVY96088.1 glycosyltransferase [Bombilactobacillus apium]